MTQLSPEARRLFQLARFEDEPENPALERIERSLAGRLAGGVGVAAASTFWAKSASGVLLGASKFVAVTVVVGAASFVGIRAMRTSKPTSTVAVTQGNRAVTQSPAVTPLAAASENAGGDEPPPARNPVVNRALAHPAASVASAVVATAEPPDQLREETLELRRAQQALRAGDATRALSLLNEQDRAFQPGQLQEERAAARVLALCQSGQVDRAHAEAVRFEQRWPKSALLARVRSACF
jgi:hypothetical protein